MSTIERVLDLVTAWARAEEANDADAIGALITDDFVGVGPFGFVLSRDAWLARFAGGLRNEALSVDDTRARDYGSAVAVVAALTQRARYQDNDASGTFRLSLLAVESGGGWRIAGVHLGPLGAPPGAA